jgi:hypothetical protein
MSGDRATLGEGFEGNAGLLVPGVVVWVGGDEGPAAFLGAGDGVRVGLGTSVDERRQLVSTSGESR